MDKKFEDSAVEEVKFDLTESAEKRHKLKLDSVANKGEFWIYTFKCLFF